MNTKRVSLAGLSGLLLAGVVAAPVHAAFVTEWIFDTTLQWGQTGTPEAPIFTQGSGTQMVTPTELSWGAAGGDMTDDTASAAQARSGLMIGDGGQATGSVFTNAGPADTVSITHYNNVIGLDFATLQSAWLLTTLTLTSTPPSGQETDFGGEQFRILFTETSNAPPCGFDSVDVCDDIFIVENPELLRVPFDFEGTNYIVEVGATGLGPLDDDTCTAAGQLPGCFGVTTEENAFSPVNYNLSVYAVPEPATVMLFGLGLLGLGGLLATRRRESLEASSA